MRSMISGRPSLGVALLNALVGCSVAGAGDGGTDDTTGGPGGSGDTGSTAATLSSGPGTTVTDPSASNSTADTTAPTNTTTADTTDVDSSAGEDDTTTGPGTPPGPSPGCGVSDVEPGSYASIEVDVDGASRTFDLFVPAAHDGVTPIPLVLAFHGWTLDAQIQANMSQMSVTADERGFAVAYPQGIGDSWNAGSCCGAAFDQNIDDLGFARALVGAIGEELCIDERRVYSTGFSNGGFMSHRLGCDAADLFAAIGPVAGVIMIPDAECTPGRAVPVMHLHGTADTSVAYGGNGMVPHISVPGSTAGWVARNGCDPEPTVSFEQDDTTCETWSNCGDDGAEVILCTIEGMGHCWPGDPACMGLMETPSLTVQASDVLADFFAAHSMP